MGIVGSLLLALVTSLLPGDWSSGETEAWFLKAAKVPRNLVVEATGEPVVIAIVDDGIRLSHTELQPFLWRNKNEVPLNRRDDDGNGFTDDTSGWDIADGDSDVNPPAGRLAEFYHGTHVAGVVTSVLTAALGDAAAGNIKLMPVKTLSDFATDTYLKSGFQGIEYAIDSGADIILCAWSVAKLSPAEAKILQRAEDEGVLIIGAAGNFPENREMFPAAHPAVLAVAGLDRDDLKMRDSNYGIFVDLSAPGLEIAGADSRSDRASSERTGTSQAAAIVAAAAGLLKWQNPALTPLDMKVALQSTTDPLPPQNPLYLARLGSGKLNLDSALKFAKHHAQERPPKMLAHTFVKRPRGYLSHAAGNLRPVVWEIDQSGEFEGCWLQLKNVTSINSGRLVVTPRLSGAIAADAAKSLTLAELERPVFVPGDSHTIMYFPDKTVTEQSWVIEYQMEPVHLPSKYCSGRTVIESPGHFEDGSGDSRYSPESNCFWHIKAPPGKVIEFEFKEFDTELGADYLYFFDGDKTNADVIATLSGDDIPPRFASWRNEVLVWFVTNSETQEAGWRASFEFVDAPTKLQEPR